MKAARAGTPLARASTKTVEVIKAGLLKLGLITDATGDQYRMLVHARRVPLHRHRRARRRRTYRGRSQPGMAFVIEPGIYIRQSALDALPTTRRRISRSSRRSSRR